MTIVIERLPDEPCFRHLLEAFTANPDHVLIKDWKKKTEASCMQLLIDMLYMRRQITQRLPDSMFDSRQRIDQERPFILILAPGNYDFVVAAFSVLCCCAAFSPLATTVIPEEASYFLELTKASCLLFSKEFQQQALSIQEYHASRNSGCNPITIIPITTYRCPTPQPQLIIDPEISIASHSASALVFTSGTTGPPKGILRPRSIWYPSPESFPSGGVALVYRPANRSATALPLLWRALNGIRSDVVNPDTSDIWDRLKTGEVTHLSLVPRSWADLMRYFNEHIDPLPPRQREQYIEGVRALQKPIVTGEFTAPAIMDFWRELLGSPLINLYGSAEMGAALSTTNYPGPVLERSVGEPRNQVEVKLSEGDYGEFLVKSPVMFTGYLGNEAATLSAFDGEGYYRTGDIGRRVGDQYVLEGRASTDVIRHYGLWVPLQEVEAQLSKLPYVSEAYVIPAEFDSRRQIAALVRGESPETLISISKIRHDLKGELHQYKLPTLLHTLKDHEKVDHSSTGKVMRKELTVKYFPLSSEGTLPSGVEIWNGSPGDVGGPRKPWDWAGVL